MAGYAQNPQIWNKQSTCTQDPVRPGAAFADTWIDASGLVKQTGLDLIVNYGLSPFDPRNPMRPDPHSEKCETQTRTARPSRTGGRTRRGCPTSRSRTRRTRTGTSTTRPTCRTSRTRSTAGRCSGSSRVGTLGGDKSRENVFFEWARVKLFDIPLGVAVWDREKACPGVPAHEPCDTLLTYPELTSVQLGNPIEARPDSQPVPGRQAAAGCVWSRRYDAGRDGRQRAEPRRSPTTR